MNYYLSYGNWAVAGKGYPKLASTYGEDKATTVARIKGSFQDFANADFIFYFDGDKTEYVKDRFQLGYQHTPEERLMVALKAVPLVKS